MHRLDQGVPHIAVVGAQWGDEGKGKVVDLLSDRFDVVARFQGGPNAGHTVAFDNKSFALHHVPSGVFRPNCKIVIGNGTVIDLEKLWEELTQLRNSGIDFERRLFISDRAHVILPLMQRLDALSEQGAKERIGTTLRGIGPTYEAKAARCGVRMGDLLDRDALRERIASILDGPTGKRLRDAGEEPELADAATAETWELGQRLAPHVTDTAMQLNEWIDLGARVLFEGAQGTMLDLDHGSYPFVTSSNTMTGGLCTGLGVAPKMVGATLGVFKAYGTRVGAGPMPTELRDGPDGDGERLRQRGKEFGTTTGRPRRCGWLDGVACRYATRINRFDGACLMLLDVLDAFEQVKICTGYEIDGKPLPHFPASVAQANRVTPIHETMPGWMRDTTGARRWNDLPPEALAFIERIGEVIGTQVVMVSVGPDRSQSILRPGSWLERLA